MSQSYVKCTEALSKREGNLNPEFAKMPKNDQSTKHWWSSGPSNKEETKSKSQAAPAETKKAPPKAKPVKKWMSAADFAEYEKRFESCKKRVQDSKDTLVEGGSLSLDSIKGFNKNLCDTDQVVVGFIQKLKVNIFESKPVRKLIDDYFAASLQILELLSELENCLRESGNSHLSLRLAAKKFENKKYGEMHEKVGNFKASGDPFKVKFWVMYVKLCDKQIALFDKVMEIHVLVNRPPPLKPKVIPKKKGHLVIHEQLQDDDDDKLNTETIEEHDIESEEEKEEDDEEEEEGGGEGEAGGEEEGELDNCVVIAEFENFRIGALSWTEKITSLSASTDTAIEDEAAKSVVDELKSEVSKFQGDIDQMVDHTRNCKDQILSGREKVLGLIKTSA